MKTETSEQTPWQRLNFLYSIHGSRQGTKAVAKLFGIGKIVTEQRWHTWPFCIWQAKTKRWNRSWKITCESLYNSTGSVGQGSPSNISENKVCPDTTQKSPAEVQAWSLHPSHDREQCRDTRTGLEAQFQLHWSSSSHLKLRAPAQCASSSPEHTEEQKRVSSTRSTWTYPG